MNNNDLKNKDMEDLWKIYEQLRNNYVKLNWKQEGGGDIIEQCETELSKYKVVLGDLNNVMLDNHKKMIQLLNIINQDGRIDDRAENACSKISTQEDVYNSYTNNRAFKLSKACYAYKLRSISKDLFNMEPKLESVTGISAILGGGNSKNLRCTFNAESVEGKNNISQCTLYPYKIEGSKIVPETSTHLAKGTMELQQFAPENNNTYLTNMYECVYHHEKSFNNPDGLDQGIDERINIVSFRYGTPVDKGNGLIDLNSQTNSIKNMYPGKRKIVISLLDTCLGICTKVASDKVLETNVIRAELEAFHNDSNICYIPTSINNNVNRKENGVFSSGSIEHKRVSDDIELLGRWIYQITRINGVVHEKVEIIKTMLRRYLMSFVKYELLYNKTKYMYINKDGAFSNDASSSLFKRLMDITLNIYDGSSIKTKTVYREPSRYYTICFISLLHNIFSRSNVDVVLMYHCKSGQDRTGTLFAINQMCNHVISTNFTEICDSIILTVDTSIDPKSAYSSWPENAQKDICMNLAFANSVIVRFFKPECVEKISQLALVISYIITFYSTGIPGIKWGLGDKKFKQSVQNIHAYLLMENNKNALESKSLPRRFEGASKLRGT
jgi:hypothetical protein